MTAEKPKRHWSTALRALYGEIPVEQEVPFGLDELAARFERAAAETPTLGVRIDCDDPERYRLRIQSGATSTAQMVITGYLKRIDEASTLVSAHTEKDGGALFLLLLLGFAAVFTIAGRLFFGMAAFWCGFVVAVILACLLWLFVASRYQQVDHLLTLLVYEKSKTV